ncbi:MAG: hypothetical protein L0Y42_14725 [Phycisphaerales bacterium]|nr:hypothetical protein [Phycisphaerales bacterium]
MTKPKVVICPYCGETQASLDRCRGCGGLFEPLSRQATHNAMGPWFIRDEQRPFQPGASYETLIKLIERGQVTKYSLLRSPTTKQFWTVARRVPGIAHLLGYCHNCDASVDPGDHGCHACGVPFGAYLDRNFLGLPDIRPLPWEVGGDEERQQSAASSRLMEFRRAAEPLGISSFASDDELRGSGLSPMPSHGRHMGGAGATSSATLPYPGTAVRGLGGVGGSSMPGQQATSAQEAVAESAAFRAMQRRLESQRQTIRWLAIALLALAAITIIFWTAVFFSQQNAASNMPGTPTAPAANGLRSDAVNGTAANGSAGPASASNQNGSAPQSIDWLSDEDYTRAQELISQARNVDRPRNERIGDYQEALRMLKAMEGRIPSGQSPKELADLIQQSNRELEQLQLEEFFP